MQQEQAGLRSSAATGNGLAPTLNTLPVSSQQFHLMRDLLLALSGVEGQYIRVAAASSGGPEDGLGSSYGDTRRRAEAAVTAAVRSSQSGHSILTAPLPKVSDTHFLIDLDTADRSVANQVGIVFSCYIS